MTDTSIGVWWLECLCPPNCAHDMHIPMDHKLSQALRTVKSMKSIFVAFFETLSGFQAVITFIVIALK